MGTRINASGRRNRAWFLENTPTQTKCQSTLIDLVATDFSIKLATLSMKRANWPNISSPTDPLGYFS